MKQGGVVIFSMHSTLKPAPSAFVNCFEIIRFVICNNYNVQFHLLFKSYLVLQKNIVHAIFHSVIIFFSIQMFLFIPEAWALQWCVKSLYMAVNCQHLHIKWMRLFIIVLSFRTATINFIVCFQMWIWITASAHLVPFMLLYQSAFKIA